MSKEPSAPRSRPCACAAKSTTPSSASPRPTRRMADPPGNRLHARFPSNVDTLRPWTAERMGSQRIHPAHAREVSPSRSGSPSSTDRATARRIFPPTVSGAGPQSTGTIPRPLPGERRPEIIAELSDLPARWSSAPRSVRGRRGEPSAESFLERTSMAGSALARGATSSDRRTPARRILLAYAPAPESGSGTAGHPATNREREPPPR